MQTIEQIIGRAQLPKRVVIESEFYMDGMPPIEIGLSLEDKLIFPKMDGYYKTPDELYLPLNCGKVVLPINMPLSLESDNHVIGVIASPSYINGDDGNAVLLVVEELKLYIHTHGPKGEESLEDQKESATYLAAQMQEEFRRDAYEPNILVKNGTINFEVDPNSYRNVPPIEACIKYNLVHIHKCSGEVSTALFDLPKYLTEEAQVKNGGRVLSLIPK